MYNFSIGVIIDSFRLPIKDAVKKAADFLLIDNYEFLFVLILFVGFRNSKDTPHARRAPDY